MKKDITCIVCPRGCRMTVNNIDGQYIVEGNSCIRGSKYGIDEVTNPRRVITSTVRLNGSYLNMLPVKTAGSIPKDMMFDIMKVLAEIRVTTPVNVGDVIVKNVLDTGVDIVSTKTMMNTADDFEEELRDAL